MTKSGIAECSMIGIMVLLFLAVPVTFGTSTMPTQTVGTSNIMVTNISNSSETMNQTGYWIVVDNLPLGTHYSGDSFIVSGETNLPVGQEIDFGAGLQGFRVGAPDINPPYFTGSAIVTGGSENVHTWSFVINTSGFQKGQEGYRNGVIQAEAIPGDYDLIIGPFNQNLYSFTLVNRTGPIETNPADIIPASTSVYPMSQQTTPSIPIPILLPIIALGIVIGMGNFRRKF